MPISAVKICKNGKWRIGQGPCKFKTRKAAVNAYEHWIRTKSKKGFDEWYEEEGQKLLGGKFKKFV